jgi:hypothetical protein
VIIGKFVGEFPIQLPGFRQEVANRSQEPAKEVIEDTILLEVEEYR